MNKRIVLIIAVASLYLSQGIYAAQTICNSNGGAGWPINDGTNTTIQIEYLFGDVGYLTDVDVDVNISHTWMGDLTASITSPAGTNVVLFSRPGTTQGATVNAGPYGCSGNNLDVLFNDESANAPIENATCGNNPAYSGNHRPHNAAPNDLSALDTENPTGVWDFNFFDPIDFDTGTMNEACLVVSAAAVTFDLWVSTNATCSDTVDAQSVVTGTNLYVCYTVSNPGDESFTLSAGDWNDSLGNNLSGLEGTYNAAVSQTVNFGPFVAGTAPFVLGSNIETADITIRGNSIPNFPSSESIFTDETISVSVVNVLPGSAFKPLYLYNNLNLSRITPTTNQAERTLNELVTLTWTLTPALQDNLALNTVGGSVPLSLYLRETGTGSDRDITFTVSGSSSGQIGTFTTTIGLTGTSSLYNINVPITGATNLVSGETIQLTIRNNTTGSGTRAVLVNPSNGTSNHSIVSLPSNTIIDVASINVYAVNYATNPTATPITYAEASDTVYIRAVITDPFGTFDITSINNLITDASPSVQATDIASTVVFNSGTNTKIYEFAYTIPAFPVLGVWRIDVTGNEGSVTEGISHSNFINFLILAPPSLSVVKTASIGGLGITTADPGATITYSIIVTNSGVGFAENVILDDVVSPYADVDTGSFSCTLGCPSSGVTMGTPSFNYDITGDVIDWSLIMGGTLNGGASFTIEYEADIEN